VSAASSINGSLLIWINGQPDTSINVADRGLQYGDGLFETIRLQNKTLPLLTFHLERLVASAARLAIPVDPQQIQKELAQFIASLPMADGVIKVMLTRGQGERGYLPPLHPQPTRIFIASRGRDTAALVEQGVVLRLCRQRIMELPEIAGIKIIGRLDLVLARNEWRDPAIHEGLLLDSRDNIIEGTMSNVFLLSHGRLLTPRLDCAGVAGVARRIVLDVLAAQLHLPVEERHIHEDDLYRADEVFICNSVAGVMPVRQFEEHVFASMQVSQKISHAFTQFVIEKSLKNSKVIN
jgi:4-amino-4-deoxychorismate lyase